MANISEIKIIDLISTAKIFGVVFQRLRMGNSWDFAMTHISLDIYLSSLSTNTTQAPKGSLRYGVEVALEAKLERQTEEDGLKWSLLKQILKVRHQNSCDKTVSLNRDPPGLPPSTRIDTRCRHVKPPVWILKNDSFVVPAWIIPTGCLAVLEMAGKLFSSWVRTVQIRVP